MAATDGVVTPSGRKLLKDFADRYGMRDKTLYRMAHAIANEVEVPEVEFLDHSHHKGKLFEDFVVSLCSDKSRFDLLAWRSDKICGQTYALENLLPDLHLRHRLKEREVEYLIECKYRSTWEDDGIGLTSQFVRYRKAARDRGMELFIALGIGGSPSNPDELLIIPGRMVGRDNKIDRFHFIKCLCPKTPDGFHEYIRHYFSKRVFGRE